MKRSQERILTTHCGSLVRTQAIIEGMKALTLRRPHDAARLDQDIRDGIGDVVRQQIASGVDVPNDGEYGRRGFTSYIHERLGGLEPLDSPTNDLDQTGHRRERDDFPDFYAQYDHVYRTMWMLPGVDMSDMLVRSKSDVFRLTGPITYQGETAVRHDIDVLKSALDGQPVADAFVTAISPAITRKDRGILDVYPSQHAYLYALADALHEEYRLIADAGLVVQLDIPQLEQSINPSGSGALSRESRAWRVTDVREWAYCAGPETPVPLPSVIRESP